MPYKDPNSEAAIASRKRCVARYRLRHPDAQREADYRHYHRVRKFQKKHRPLVCRLKGCDNEAFPPHLMCKKHQFKTYAGHLDKRVRRQVKDRLGVGVKSVPREIYFMYLILAMAKEQIDEYKYR